MAFFVTLRTANLKAAFAVLDDNMLVPDHRRHFSVSHLTCGINIGRSCLRVGRSGQIYARRQPQSPRGLEIFVAAHIAHDLSKSWRRLLFRDSLSDGLSRPEK